MNILILSSNDGYEAMYVDGKLHDQGSTLGEGNSKIYLLKKSEELGFSSDDVSFDCLSDNDDKFVSDTGAFPEQLSEFSSSY